MRLTEKATYMLLGGGLVLAGVAAAHVAVAFAATTADEPAAVDVITVRDLRVVDGDGEVRLRLHVAPVDDPGGPVDILQVWNTKGVVVHRMAIYGEGSGGGTFSVGGETSLAAVELMGPPGMVVVRSGQGDGRARVVLKASGDVAEIAALGSAAEAYVGPADGAYRAASLRADYNGGVLSLANPRHQPRVVLRVDDDDTGVVTTLGEHENR